MSDNSEHSPVIQVNQNEPYDLDPAEKEDNSPVDEHKNHNSNEPSKNPNNSPSEKASDHHKENLDHSLKEHNKENLMEEVKQAEKSDENSDDDDADEDADADEDSHKDKTIYSGFNFSNIESIKSYILEYKTLLENYEKEFTNPEVLEYFILSTSFIKEWKEFVSYDEIINEKPPCKAFGKSFPEFFNKDLLHEEKSDMEVIARNDEEKCQLKEGLQENVDFKIVSKEIMNFFKKNFHGRDIPRRAYILPNGHKRVEIYYKKVQYIVITNQVLRDADLRNIQGFSVNYSMQFSQLTLQNFKEMVLEYVQAKFGRKSSYYSTASNYQLNHMRIWKLDSEISLSEAFAYVKKICNNTSSYDYRIEMKGKYLENNLDMKIEDLNLQHNEYLIVEVREETKGWNFVQDGVPSMEKCEYCNKYDKLFIFCGCKKVAYCSDECKMKDKRFHSMRCEKTDEEELEVCQLNQNSRLGLTGLTNLGNTCFMNSALQCISHTYLLTKYFLEDSYKTEINETNPLGTKGKLTDKYTILLKNLWFKSNTVFSPYGIKNALAQLNPMFSGYNQHDSQEFLSYLLDGLHEDLNRVKVKPYTETIESNGQADEKVSRDSWTNHLKRNNSIITDLMHGQYKSKIICPDCHRVSITFDPFLTCTLPLPTKEKQKIDFYFIFADNRTIPVKIELWYKKRNHFISNLKDQVVEELKPIKNLAPKAFNFYFLSNTSCTKVHHSTLTNEVRKKRKMGNLFAIEMDPSLLSSDESKIVEVPLTFVRNEHYYSSFYTKKPFTFIRPFHFLKTDTTNEIHFKIFKYFRFYFEELLKCADETDKEEKTKSLDELLSLNDLEAFAKIFGKPDERPYNVLITTNARSYMSCFFCGEYRCENCKLSESDTETLDDLLQKIKSKDFSFELEVYWPNPPNSTLDIGQRFNKYDKLHKEDNQMEKEEVKKEEETKSSNNKRPFIITKNLHTEEKTGGEAEEKNLYECFNLFSEPETLNADNAWYCNVCKEHKEATKEMKIYKASKYLILHLKRFKGGESILSSGKISTKINFPTVLDLTDIVMNHEIPTSAPEKLEESSKIQEKTEITNELTVSPQKKIDASDIEEIDLEVEGCENSNKKDQSTKKLLTEDAIKEEKEIIEKPDSNEPKKKLLYRLYAISNHYGSVGFGHYTAFALHPKDNSWYCFDDSSVNMVSEDQIVTPAAYILFYERIENEDQGEKSCEFKIPVQNNQNNGAINNDNNNNNNNNQAHNNNPANNDNNPNINQNSYTINVQQGAQSQKNEESEMKNADED